METTADASIPIAGPKGRWLTRWIPHPIKQAVQWELQAIRDAWLTRASYSQHGEDTIVAGITPSTVTPATHMYVEVGANHPTHIANTYLFYRRGFSGLLIEPTVAFAPLYRRYRRRDTHLAIGCAAAPALLAFPGSGSVMDSFDSAREAPHDCHSFAPVFPLDVVLPAIGDKKVFLLSIDCEGLDLEVLRSGPEVLALTDTVIVEFGRDAGAIGDLLTAAGFHLSASTKHNQIWSRHG